MALPEIQTSFGKEWRGFKFDSNRSDLTNPDEAK
jgi:hypothetical protein